MAVPPLYPANAGYAGAADIFAEGSDFNAVSFVVQQIVGRLATSALVRVQAVTNAGGIAPVGFVDVLPLVNQLDGQGNAVPHGTIRHLPYIRMQGGANAVILDPQVGDLGLAIFCSRDISVVKTTKTVANPGSFRKFDWADGLYLGGCLNTIPTQIVQFSAAGITMTSPTAVTITAPTIALNGNVTSTGTFANNGHAIGSTHLHTSVAAGIVNSGPPV